MPKNSNKQPGVLQRMVSRRKVQNEIRLMRRCAIANTELALKLTYLKPQFARGVAEGLRIAAQALENAIAGNEKGQP